jgi:hypothetical protein
MSTLCVWDKLERHPKKPALLAPELLCSGQVFLGVPGVIPRQFPDTPYGVPEGVRQYDIIYTGYDLPRIEKAGFLESTSPSRRNPGQPVGGVGELSGNYPGHPPPKKPVQNTADLGLRGQVFLGFVQRVPMYPK